MTYIIQVAKKVALGRSTAFRYRMNGQDITVKKIKELDKIAFVYSSTVGHYDKIKLKEKWKGKLI